MAHYTVGAYLLARLQEAGIGHLFGVPGDYNLQFLDEVITSREIGWVGCANELNAAYAADGYARCRGAAALLTTFGVGELSALNGVAGSYAEYLPVVHIVGAPASTAAHQGLLLHHTPGDGDYQRFLRISREVTEAQAMLTPDNAAAEIDRLLQIALTTRRPVYLYLPTDVAKAETDPPVTPLQVENYCDPVQLAAFAKAAERLLSEARNVALLADFLADRAGQQQALQRLLEKAPMTFATLLMGKGVLPEQQRGFAGTYAGAASAGETQRIIEQSDALITVGVLYVDTITAGFSQNIDATKTVDIALFSSQIGGRQFTDIPMAQALQTLEGIIDRYAAGWAVPEVNPPPLEQSSSDSLTQSGFWQAIQAFLRPGDIVLADQGTAAFGAAALRLPQDVTFICQPLWGSIGYTLPAAYGAQIACPNRRVVLLCGDGAAQLTIQELGSLLRDGLTPVIFILNNAGYTVERAIHGEVQRYNDIAAWNWTLLPQALSLDCEAQSWRVHEGVQLAQVLALIERPSRLSLVEVMLPPLDVPPLLQAVTKALSRRNDT